MSTPNSLRAVVYARYSTDKQRDISIEDQLRVCGRLCNERGYVQVAAYCDAALSGDTVARRDLKRLLEDAKAGRFDVIVLDSLPRLARHPADLHALYRHLDFVGIKLVTVDIGDIGLMHVSVYGTVSGLSLEATSRETFRNQEGEVLRGKIMGGRRYGYRTVRGFDENGKVITGSYEIVPEEAEVIYRIYWEYAEGKSAQAIAAGLNADGIPGPRGRHWQHTTILGHRTRGTGILNNELYIGVYVWNRQKFKTKPVSLEEMTEMEERRSRPRVARPNDPSKHIREEHPELAIVPREIWDAVKARQAANDAKIDAQQRESGGSNRRAGIGSARRSLTTLAGRLFCGACGGKMTASGGRYVQCSTAVRTGGSICANKKNHRRDLIEARVFDGLGALLGTPPMVQLFQKAYGKELGAANDQRAGAHKALEGELGRVEQDIANLIAAVRRGFDNLSIKAELNALEARRAEIQAESEMPAPDALTPHPEAESLWQAKIQALSGNVQAGPEGQPLREALRGLIDRVVLAADKNAEHGFSIELEGLLLDIAGPRPR